MNDDELRRRLGAELDHVQPLYSTPRYLASRPRPVAWRLAPAVLAVSVIGILGLSALVATGSANPAVWGHDVVTIIQSSSTTPTPSPSPSPTTHAPRPVTKPSPEPEHKTPEPSDDHSGSDSHDGGSSDSEEAERS